MAIELTRTINENITAAFEAVNLWESILGESKRFGTLDYPVEQLAERLYASCCVRIGQDDDAARIYKSLLEASSADPTSSVYCDLKMSLGRCYLRLLRYKEAFQEFLDAGSRREAAICGLRLGDVTLAQSVLQNRTMNDTSSPFRANLLYQVLSELYAYGDSSPIPTFLAGKVVCFERYPFRKFCEANNAGFDDPMLIHLDDKVLLHRLLLEKSFWPRGAIIHELVASDDVVPGTLCILKKRAGYGSYGNSIVRADLETAVRLCKNKKSKEGEQMLLQEMIQQPLLIGDRKFSMRVFVVRVGIHSTYLYLEGLVKFASAKWSNDTTLLSQQMTNSGRSECMDQQPLSFLSHQLGGFRYSNIWDQIRQSTTRTLNYFDDASVELSIDGSSISSKNLAKHRYWVNEIGLPKILGFDFLVDVDDHVWLLEVNRFPGLEPRDSVDSQVKKHLVKAVWEKDFGNKFIQII